MRSEQQAGLYAGVGGLLVLWALRRAAGKLAALKIARQLDERAKMARQLRDDKEHKCLQNLVLPPKDRQRAILKASVAELRGMMARKEVKCSEVMAVYISRAREIGRGPINCVTEEFYDEAMERAREVDQLPQEAWEDPNLVLLGIPVSIKDQFHQRGADSTCGTSVRCLQPRSEDGLLVALLRRAGAIPFVRTNVPQLLMLPESENHIWGVSRNPYGLEFTVGGSSGGEGGLISAFASPLGLGSDIGGSIRIPSHFNGITGFKATPERMTRLGSGVPRKGDRNGQLVIRSTAGPMARSVDDCACMMRVFWGADMFANDPSVPPLVFDNNAYTNGTGKRLRVGLVSTDHFFQPCATVLRAVREAGEALTKAGCEVVDLEIPEAINGWAAARLLYGLLGAEGNMHGFMTGLEGEALYPSYRALKALSDIPNFARPLVRQLLGLLGEHRKRQLMSVGWSGGLNTRVYWELCADLVAFRDQWLQLIDEANLDAVVLPGLTTPAFKIGTVKDLSSACTYTFLVNLLHWPACALPVTTVAADEQSYPMESLPANQRDSLAKALAKGMEDSEGLPCGVQVMTRPNRDELCLHVSGLLQRHLQPISPPPLANLP